MLDVENVEHHSVNMNAKVDWQEGKEVILFSLFVSTLPPPDPGVSLSRAKPCINRVPDFLCCDFPGKILS